MEIKCLKTTARSAVIEIKDGGVYNTHLAYKLSVKEMSPDIYSANPSRIIEDDRCIVSVFDLAPEKEYLLTVEFSDGEALTGSFKTEFESVTLNVRDFGAAGDGKADDTPFIQAAILCCPEDGRVLIPKGRYMVSGIWLKSNMNIELAKGAELCLTKDRARIPKLPGHVDSYDGNTEHLFGSWEGNPLPMYNALLTGFRVSNVNIYGEGVLNGNATKEDWWKNPKAIRPVFRPRTVFLGYCEDVSLQGITVKNSPSWTIHPYFSKKLGFYNVSIINPWDSPNTDGIDPESCEEVKIYGVHFSLGDDCIAVKSGKIYMGRKYKTPSSNLHIYQCLMEYGHGAVTVGSESAAGVRGLVVENCRFYRTDRGLRLKTRRGRGEDSVHDNIIFRNIVMDEVVTPFVVNAFYCCDTDGKSDYVQNREALPVDERTPVMKTIIFEDINCTNCHNAAGWIEGLPERKIEKLVLKNITVSYSEEAKAGRPSMALHIPECRKRGFVIRNVEKLDIDNVKVDECSGEAFEII